MTEQQNTQELVLKSSYINWFQLIIAGAVGIGSFLAYSEYKYVPKELYNSEVATLKDLIKDQSRKIDKIYDRIIEKERK